MNDEAGILSVTDEQTFDYDESVRRLIFVGENDHFKPEEWPNHVADFGLGMDDVPELLRMVADKNLQNDDTDGPELWARTHAWRALGRLQAQAAVQPLLSLLDIEDYDEFLADEIPAICALIGKNAIPELADFLLKEQQKPIQFDVAIFSLKTIAKQYPDMRDECIAVFVKILENEEHANGEKNGLAIWALLDLMAVETIDVIRAAFRRNAVDLSLAGDEEDVEIALGLRTRRATPKPRYQTLPPGWAIDEKQMPQKSEKIGRNDPCPCGSGKKYKKCCLR